MSHSLTGPEQQSGKQKSTKNTRPKSTLFVAMFVPILHALNPITTLNSAYNFAFSLHTGIASASSVLIEV